MALSILKTRRCSEPYLRGFVLVQGSKLLSFPIAANSLSVALSAGDVCLAFSETLSYEKDCNVSMTQ